MLKTTIRRIILLLSFLLLAGGVLAQGTGVRAVVVNEFANIRIAPALGADVIDTVSAGHEFSIVNGRSADNEWIRVDYLGNEGWVNLAPLVLLSGSLSSLPVADPRTIPYGGFESPRSGPSNAVGPINARATDGLRLRAGPSRAYPTLANININTIVTVTGRTGSTQWFQVQFDGILGWVSGQYLEFQGPGNVLDLPIDGVVASAPPRSDDTSDNYVAELKFMRDRLNLAQPSLDQIRGQWTDAALNGRAICQSYPPRPSDIHIAVPLLAAFYPTLNPLQEQFNEAMRNVRVAIDLFIEVCNQPGTGNPVGTATVQGALDHVNRADALFLDLRARLNELIPPDLSAGAGECLLAYNGRAQILPVILPATIYIEKFDAKKFITGYCFDAIEGRVYLFDSIQLANSNLQLFMSISPLDNPTNFIAVGRGGGTSNFTVAPIRIPKTGRYLLILNYVGDPSVRPAGDFAFIVLDVTDATVNPQLVFDPNTGAISAQAGGVASGTSGGTTGGAPAATQEAPTVVCPSLAFTCNQLFTCQEAQACLGAGNFSLDPDSDGLPCEESLCSP